MINFHERQDSLRKDYQKHLERSFGGNMSALAETLSIPSSVMSDFLKDHKYMRSANYKKLVNHAISGNCVASSFDIGKIGNLYSQIDSDQKIHIRFMETFKPEDSARIELLNLFIYGGNIREFKNRHEASFAFKEKSHIVSLSEDHHFPGLAKVVGRQYENAFDRHTKISQYSFALDEINNHHHAYIYGFTFPNYFLDKESKANGFLFFAVGEEFSKILKISKDNSIEGLDSKQKEFCENYAYELETNCFITQIKGITPAFMESLKNKKLKKSN